MKLVNEKILIGCGVALIIIPFMGIPSSWKTVLTVVIGLAVVYLSTLIYKAIKMHERTEHAETKTGTFTEVH